MPKAKVVIGANFGDEGKGLMTDYFASQMNPDQTLIVRFNGGAQAGHTVVSADGRRHVFSHFGSGSLLGCPTYLSSHFIVNPMFFGRELEELHVLGSNPFTYLDERAIVTTPFDVFINQLIEKKRAGARHGSCGLGINETVTRSLRSPEFRVTVKDMMDEKILLQKLNRIKTDWLVGRLQEYKIDTEDETVHAFMSKTEIIISRYLQDVNFMLDKCSVTRHLPNYDLIIFEGAQGLMLDEARIDQYPHLTRSRTGLTNVLEIAEKSRLKIGELDVTYVSRTYLTRHGAGPLKNEDSWSLPDFTNVPNEFQGKLRFAPLNLDELNYSINLDLKQAKHKLPKITASIAITCADQMDVPASRDLPLPVSHISYGPSRHDVQSLSKTQFASCSKSQ